MFTSLYKSKNEMFAIDETKEKTAFIKSTYM